MNIPPPIDRRVTVALPPAEAFDLFTQQMRLWWPFVGHSCFDAEAADVQFEPRAGGAVVEHARDGRTWPWGTLVTWSPPEVFSMEWHPGLPAEVATRLVVRFRAVPVGTEVQVHHDRWEARGDAAQDKRDQYDGGWPQTLAAFAAYAARGAQATGSAA
jgi:hypothetical protein